MNRENVAVITEKEQLSYGQLKEETDRIASVLEERTVAVLVMEHELANVLFYLACMKKGVVPILLDAGSEPETVKEYVQRYRPHYILLSGGSREYEPVPSYERMACGQGAAVWKSLRMTETVRNDKLALLLTTSGTSGVSRLVRISRDNLRCNTKSICEYLKIRPEERAITVLPLSYTYGLSVLHTHLFAGATVLLTKRSILQKEFWGFFERNEATSLSGVPFTYELLEKGGFLEKRIPSLNTMTQAGGKLPVPLQRKFGEYAVSHGIRLYLMYGQTEATARMSYLPPEDILRKPGSAGIAIPGGRLYLERAENGEADEIVYAGENVSLGYAAGREDLDKGDDNRGVLHTGDTGYLDEEGYLYITGRQTAFAKIHGRRINLQELSERVRERWDIPVSCKEDHGKIRVEYEWKTEEKMSEILEWLGPYTKLGRHCFVPCGRKELRKSTSGKYL